MNTMENDLSDVLDEEEGIISDSGDNEPTSLHLSSSKGKKPTREVMVASIDTNTETLVITQKVEVKKQKKKRQININTLLDTKIRKNRKMENSKLDRVVPNCSRLHCRAAIYNKFSYKTDRSRRKRLERRSYKNQRSISKYSLDSKYEIQFKNNNLEKGNNIEEQAWSILSTTSGSATKEHQISYDNVSMGSFTCCSDNELDMLIKRTKLREKDMTVSSSFLCDPPVSTSTPLAVINISSDENSGECSKKDAVSIHSQETILLETQQDQAGSPIAGQESHPTLLMKEKQDNKYCTHTLPTLRNKCESIFSKTEFKNTKYSIDPDTKPNSPYFKTSTPDYVTNNNEYNYVNRNNKNNYYSEQNN